MININLSAVTTMGSRLARDGTQYIFVDIGLCRVVFRLRKGFADLNTDNYGMLDISVTDANKKSILDFTADPKEMHDLRAFIIKNKEKFKEEVYQEWLLHN